MTRQGWTLSGVQLFWLLVGLLSLAAYGLDWVDRRSSLGFDSLFLPLISGLLLSAVLGQAVVPVLRRLKAGQVIREDGPQAHLKKAGTPTMGGIFVIPIGLAIALFGSNFQSQVVAAACLTLAYGFIGWLDDWRILRRKSNKGISPLMKLLLQVGFGALFCAWMFSFYRFGLEVSLATLTHVDLPWGIVLPIGVLFWPLAMFVLTAESNATNLTDGLDGLAAGTGAIVLFGLGALITNDQPELALFCTALSGSYLGFLFHNRNPARVFMGDTGSLALGGALGAVALLTNTLWALFVMGGLFFLESISVLLQVSYYKATKGPDGVGQRLFKMAPFHHHLELSGWRETQIVLLFYGVTIGLVALCFGLPT